MDEIEEKKEFMPKPIQVKFAELYMQVPRKTQIEIARELGVHENTVANWLHNKELRAWLNTKCNKMIESSLVKLYRVGIEKALRGKFDFWKVIMELAGIYQPGMKINTDKAELIKIEVVQAQAQQQVKEVKEDSIESQNS